MVTVCSYLNDNTNVLSSMLSLTLIEHINQTSIVVTSPDISMSLRAALVALILSSSSASASCLSNTAVQLNEFQLPFSSHQM